MASSSAAAPWGYLALLTLWPAAVFTARCLSRWRPPPPTALSRLGSLDGVRGILALAVMAHHFRIAWNWRVSGRWELPPEALFSNLGPAGVIVFFMITGFLFWGKLVGDGGRLALTRFAVGRMFRIFPAYLLSLLAIAVLSGLTAKSVEALPPAEALGSLVRWLVFSGDPNVGFRGVGDARTINAGVIWTLQYEWAFYATLPFVGLVLATLRPAGGARIVALAAMTAFASLYPAPPIGGFQLHIAVGFLYGALTFEALRSETAARAMRSPAASALGVIALAGMLFSEEYPFRAANYALLWVPFLAVAAGNAMFGLLRSREAIALGDASYSLYLFHGLFVFAFFALLPPGALGHPATWLGLPLLGAAACLWSLLCFRHVEAPAIDFGRRLGGRRRPVTPSEEVAP